MNRLTTLVFVAAALIGLWRLYSWVSDIGPGPVAVRFHRVRHFGYSDEEEAKAHLCPWFVGMVGESRSRKYCEEVVQATREGGFEATKKRFKEIIDRRSFDSDCDAHSMPEAAPKDHKSGVADTACTTGGLCATKLDICKASTDVQCAEILKVYQERGPTAAEELRVKYWEQYRSSNPPPAEDAPIPQAQREQTEDGLMFQAARLCQSDEDLKKPECVTALNAYRMKAAQRILAQREAYGPAPVPMRSGSSSHFPPPQPPPRDQVYYLHDGTKVRESPGGMRQITPPNQSALPTRRSR